MIQSSEHDLSEWRSTSAHQQEKKINKNKPRVDYHSPQLPHVFL